MYALHSLLHQGEGLKEGHTNFEIFRRVNCGPSFAYYGYQQVEHSIGIDY